MGGSVKGGGLRFEVFRRNKARSNITCGLRGLCQCKLSEWVLRYYVFLSSISISQ